MRLNIAIAAASLLAIAGATSAEARRYDSGIGYDGPREFYDDQDSGRSTSTRHKARRVAYAGDDERPTRRSSHRHRSSNDDGGGSIGGRPRQWCGWWMRTQKGGGAHLNLAANWRGWGSPSSAQVGAVVVWPHHVGMITGRTASGQWIVKSGNDGGAVRERARSVSGAVFRVG